MSENTPFNHDQLLQVLKEMTPPPVQVEQLPEEAVRLIGGNPGDVVIDVSPDNVTVAQYAVNIASDQAQILAPRILGKVSWPLLPEWTTRRILGELIAAGTAARREEYRECLRCRQKHPPEEMNSANVCSKCTANEDGLVY